MRKGIATVLLTALAGCSVIGVRPVPWTDQQGEPTCSSWAFPAADAAGSVAMILVGRGVEAFGNAISECGSHNDCKDSFTKYIPALILAGSAVYGVVGNGLCRSRLGRAPPDAPAESPIPH